jgi:hypothetical protein
MDTSIQPRDAKTTIDFQQPVPTSGSMSDEGTANSRENVSRWRTYLPEDCVRTMIAMGWDITT